MHPALAWSCSDDRRLVARLSERPNYVTANASLHIFLIQNVFGLRGKYLNAATEKSHRSLWPAAALKITIKAAIVAKKTDRLSHVDAAALALAGLTAICAIEDTLKLQAGETILIQGGAGGVASFAIQLAKHLCARVIKAPERCDYETIKTTASLCTDPEEEFYCRRRRCKFASLT
jgi:hypothetical protein